VLALVQVAAPVNLTAGEPFLLDAYLYDGGGVGHVSIGVQMPAELSGMPTWNSIPQKQVISWGADHHGLRWRLAATWARSNQTAAVLSVTGSQEDLLNPRNGIRISVGGGSSLTAAFSIGVNSTWANHLGQRLIRERAGPAPATERNTDVQITGSAAEGRIQFLFVADRDVNADLLSAEHKLSAELVRSVPPRLACSTCLFFYAQVALKAAAWIVSFCHLLSSASPFHQPCIVSEAEKFQGRSSRSEYCVFSGRWT
jgi:hypothetical protein